ncbi:MAG: response regulator transcription factor, partial [Flavobacteriales bacterium]|nr:response regulator transcription factor [Flavobacteriales bacterium]
MEENYRVLVVEDEEHLRSVIKLNLELEGYDVATARTGPRALEKFRNGRFDVAILDVMLPEVDGFTVCKTIRLEGNKTPILFLTAKNSSSDRVEGLKIGGDDYLTKPFNLEELLLRIQNLIRRTSGSKTSGDLENYKFGKSEVFFLSYEIKDKDGITRRISKKETMLLKLLMQNEGKAVSREEILETVWGYNVFPSTR